MSFETQIDEQIKVWAFFDLSLRQTQDKLSSGQASIFPIAMNWRQKIIKFKKLIFASNRKVGQIKIVNLVCASETANYELEFNPNNFLWKLKKVIPKEM